jgi:hypothetical protein
VHIRHRYSADREIRASVNFMDETDGKAHSRNNGSVQGETDTIGGRGPMLTLTISGEVLGILKVVAPHLLDRLAQ